MTLRRAHGTGADALLRVETSPADELPLGVQGPPHVAPRVERRADGTFAPGARTAQSAGGSIKKNGAEITARLGVGTLPDGSPFAPYRRRAATFRRVQCAELARTVGGGVCGPGVSSIVATAALALAWSRYFSDAAARDGDSELAVKAIRLGEASRQSLLTAHELCAREAEARKRVNPGDPQADYRARILGGT